MKNLLVLSLSLLLVSGAFAQNKTGGTKQVSATGVKPAATTSSATPADCYINKTWHLSKVEKFGVTNNITSEQKLDMLYLGNDGTFKMVINGVEKTGTWTRGTYMSLKPADGSDVLPVKIESCDSANLKVDYKDGDTHNHFMYTL